MIRERIVQHQTFIIVGFVMIIATLVKLLLGIPIDSDWFWFIAAVAITIEGVINLSRQRKFDNKYKIISKKEFDLFEEFKKKR